jgi:hypothetical protein
MATDRSRQVDVDTAREIALEAYIYLYPLITMDLTRRQMTNLPAGVKPAHGPAGAFAHAEAFPPADAKAVVRPNFDTLYSSAWIDLSVEPVIVSVPDTGGRYYCLPLYDMWTDAFAVPGWRTSGTAERHFALAYGDWKGALPHGVERIASPTPTVWIIGRIQTNGPADYAAVRALQAGLRLTPLSSWGGAPLEPPFAKDPTVDDVTPPLDQVNGLSGADYFAYGAELLKHHPPHASDWSTLARFRRIGIDPGTTYNLAAQPPEVQAAIADTPAAALAFMRERLATLARMANGWSVNTDSMGVYGNWYVKRAVIAMVGLGALPAEDAIYPLCLSDADGAPLDGSNAYVMHFEADALPPVSAFWSVTMYDAEGFQVANELDRFAIGDRDELRFHDDGSLDLYLQHDNPGPDKVANWLPAPRGPLGVTMRLYAPKAAALNGSWNPPPVRRV